MIKKIIKGMLSLVPTKKLLVFESIPNLSDNTKPVFDEMIKRGMNEKYKFLWIVDSINDDLPKIKNVSYLAVDDPNFKYKILYTRLFARVLFSCNRFLTSLRKGQVSIHITHGTCIKSTKNYYNVPKGINYVLIDGEATKEVMAYELNFDVDKMVALGYPRNDVFVGAQRDISDLFPENKGDKIAVWYPTSRKTIAITPVTND